MVGSVRWHARLAVSVALMLFALNLVLPAPAGAARPLERRLVRYVNNARADAGRPPVRLRDALSDAARRHSRRMAAAGEWFHSDGPVGQLLNRVDVGWGENVGHAPSVATMHQWFMRSPLHRANILSGGYDRVGVGVVVRNGTYWITELFLG